MLRRPCPAVHSRSRSEDRRIIDGRRHGPRSAVSDPFHGAPKDLAERVFGNRVTVIARLEAVTRPIFSRMRLIHSCSISAAGRFTPAFNTMKPHGISPFERIGNAAHSAPSLWPPSTSIASADTELTGNRPRPARIAGNYFLYLAAAGLHSCRLTWNYLLEEFWFDRDLASKRSAVSSDQQRRQSNACRKECHRYGTSEPVIAMDHGNRNERAETL